VGKGPCVAFSLRRNSGNGRLICGPQAQHANCSKPRTLQGLLDRNVDDERYGIKNCELLQTQTLDGTLLALHGGVRRRIDVVKMDVESFECNVLAGAQQLLDAQPRFLLIEGTFLPSCQCVHILAARHSYTVIPKRQRGLSPDLNLHLFAQTRRTSPAAPASSSSPSTHHVTLHSVLAANPALASQATPQATSAASYPSVGLSSRPPPAPVGAILSSAVSSWRVCGHWESHSILWEWCACNHTVYMGRIPRNGQLGEGSALDVLRAMAPLEALRARVSLSDWGRVDASSRHTKMRQQGLDPDDAGLGAWCAVIKHIQPTGGTFHEEPAPPGVAKWCVCVPDEALVAG